jgi:hypothetical protein
MVAMPVADDQIFNRRRIQSQLAQPLDDRVLDGVVEQRIDDDETVGRLDGPRAVKLGADEVQIVEYLRGRLIPRVACRHLARRCRSAAAALRLLSRIANLGKAVVESEVFSSSDGTRSSAMRLARIGGLLRGGTCREHGRRERAECQPVAMHSVYSCPALTIHGVPN